MSHTEDQLIGQHAPLVRRLALQMISRLPASVELDDLMQAGMMGLLDAVRRYQDTGAAKFETYATTRIRGAMLDELRSQDWLPRNTRQKARQIEQAIHKLEQQLLRPPHEQEIAQALGTTLPEYHALLEEAHGVQVLHYEDTLTPQGDADGLPTPAAEGAWHWHTPLEQLADKNLQAALVRAIEALPERERLVLSLQFEQDLNQKEIAAVLGVTEGRISQLRTQAISRLRASMADGPPAPKPPRARPAGQLLAAAP